MPKKLIAIDASPNLTAEDLMLSLKELVTPWNWNKKNYLKELHDYFLKQYNAKEALITQSGRAALYILLSTAIKPGDEVITQAFTCLVVPNSIAWAGGVPVFADIDKKNYNFDLVSLEKKITKKTKAIIVQHTFGIPGNLSEIQAICKKHGLMLIEDCAHALGAEYEGELVGSFGDGTIFSFNQDKVVSGINGGALIIKNPEMLKKFKELNLDTQSPSRKHILKSLLHPLIWFFALPLYNLLSIGKGIIFLAWKVRLLGNTVTPLEQKGKRPKEITQSLSNPQARLVLLGLKRLEKDNLRRVEIAKKYKQELNFSSIIHPEESKNTQSIYLRYPVQVEGPKGLLSLARRNGIILGRWYDQPIFPWNETSQKYYNLGECPVAEKKAQKIINLPTMPHLKNEEVETVIKVIKQAYGKN
jgi:perosamine synthetase